MVEVENPGTKSVESLLQNVKDGSYVIPYFQRGFEWEPSMVAELFESILQEYYTGLLLFWDLDDYHASQEQWDPVWGAERKTSPEMAVLDGQQRLSSLYYAIHNPAQKFPSRKSYYVFYLDPVKVLNEEYEEAVTYNYYRYYRDWSQLKDHEQWISQSKIPLTILSQTDPANPDKAYIHSREFEEWITRFLNERESDLPDDVITWNVRDIFQGILGYSFVIYPLDNDRDLQDICNIFAKVNASGMKLSTFDLLNAFLYPFNVELRKDLWENLEYDLLKDVDTNMAENILKIISLHKQNYCSSKYLYNLIPGEETVREEPDGTRYEEILVDSGDEFKNLWKSAADYAEEARKLLMNTGTKQFGAIRTEFIPHGTILPVLAAVLWEYDGQVQEEKFRQQLNQWYWSAVFSMDYSGSSDTIMGRDFRDWKKWLSTQSSMEQLEKVDESFLREMDLKGEDKGTGRYNAVICLIALNGAEDFYEGNIVGTVDFSGPKINDHHIFPKKVEGIPPDKMRTFSNYRDSIVNRTLIFDETNSKIERKQPSEYIQHMISRHGDESSVKELFQNHLISEQAYEYLKEDEFDNFVDQREKDIKAHLIQKLDLST